MMIGVRVGANATTVLSVVAVGVWLGATVGVTRGTPVLPHAAMNSAKIPNHAARRMNAPLCVFVASDDHKDAGE
jgi:hypothetical protein